MAEITGVQVDKLAAILEIVALTATGLGWDEILAELTRRIGRLMEVDGCTLAVWDQENNKIVVMADYVSPEIETPFAGVNHVSAAYPLAHFPATVQVLEQQSPLIVYFDDPAADQAEKQLLETFHWSGALLLPILFQGRTLGLLRLASAGKQGHPFTNEQLALGQTLAGQVGLVLENARLHQEGAEGHLHAEALQVIGRALASELDYQRIVRDVADFAYRLVGAQFVYVAVPEGEALQPVATAGRIESDSSAIHTPEIPSSLLKHNFVGRAVTEERPIVVADITADPVMTPWQAEAELQGWKSAVASPLLSHNRLVGVLVAYGHQPNSFGPGDIATLMSLASQAAVAIHNAQLFTELEAQREALRQVSLRLVNAQEAERRLISRELHDELGQALTALKINLDLARRALSKDAPAKLRQSIHEAGSLAIQTLETARNMSLALHPAMLDDLGLLAALRWEIDRYEQRTGQVVQFEAELAGVELQAELEITIFRIIIEALTNAARHAQASEIRISLKLEKLQIMLKVEDNGVGFEVENWLNSPGERKSLGLISMRERAELLGGSLDIISNPGQGTTVQGKLPIAA